jgi:tetratricopeptide (TPR) repeat protein
MPKSPREIINAALQSCIKFHEEAEYESAEVVLRQTLRAFQQAYYTEADEVAQDHYEKGMYAIANREIEPALDYFSEAYKLKPDLRPAFINMIYCNFELKRYETLWRLYEDRTIHFDQLIAYKKIFDPKKKWNGVDSLESKTIAIFCEQGIGDQINFSRYIPLIKEKYDCRIIANCAAAVAPVFESFSFVDEVIVKENVTTDSPIDCDYHVPQMSLSYLLEHWEPLEVEQYVFIEEKMELPENDKFKIGIIWQGNPRSENDPTRSISVNWFRQLFDKNTQVYSLHNALDSHIDEIIDLKDDINNFQDLAEAVNSMDLIVTVDTALLHLAGAMNKPVWALIPFVPDWRWGLNGEETIWYPSARLFRQDYPGDWDGVFKKIKSELQHLR